MGFEPNNEAIQDTFLDLDNYGDVFESCSREGIEHNGFNDKV